ncbi:MAG: MFS transporter [Candidatus Omnitrophica bacterium]|nr:MFS transporter [Candidatus Omnitrophota bacterium]
MPEERRKGRGQAVPVFGIKGKKAAGIFSWSLFDLAIKFFTLNIISLHFVRWLTIEKGVEDIYYSLAFGSSMVIVALMAPFSGRIFDLTGLRDRMFTVFVVAASLLTVSLGMISRVFPALAVFAAANLFLQLAIVIYNALLRSVAPPGRMGMISGLGKMFGFAGAIGVLYLMEPVAAGYGYNALFAASGVLLFVFSLPCMVFVRTDRTGNEKELSVELISSTARSMLTSFRQMRLISGVTDLLKASFLLFCSMNALMLFMAVYLSKVFGLREGGIINAIALATFAAILGSLVFGILSDRIGYKKGLYIASVMLITAFLAAGIAYSRAQVLVLAAVFGAAYGAVLSVSRPLAVSLVPEERTGELFGLIALVGYTAALAGPLFWGVSVLAFSPAGTARYRIVVALLSVFLFPALYYFRRIPGKGDKR